jgi:hypothetical protein
MGVALSTFLNKAGRLEHTLSVLSIRCTFVTANKGNTLTTLFSWFFRTFVLCIVLAFQQKKKLHGLSPRANYTDRATAACQRSDCQLLRIEGATWSA